MDDLDKRKLALRMMDDGETIADIARATGLEQSDIKSNCLSWATELRQSDGGAGSLDNNRGRFFTKASTVFTPSNKMLELLPDAAKALESGDVEAFFEKVAPIAALQMAYDSVMVTDDAVRQKAQKDILDRAGFKPREKIEVYSKYDGMQKDEIIGLIRGILMQQPDLVGQLIEAQERVMIGANVVTVKPETMEEVEARSADED
jgi:hypothetical protein